MKDIQIDVGVCTALTVNLENFDFTGIEKIIFTVKNVADPKFPAIIEREFTEAKTETIIVTAEESIKLAGTAVYDFNEVLADGTRLKLTDNGRVILRKGVGDCVD